MRWSTWDTRSLEVVLLIGILSTAVLGIGAPLLGRNGLRVLEVGEGSAVMHVDAQLRPPVPVPGAPVLGTGPIETGAQDSVEMDPAGRARVTFWAPTAGQRAAWLAGPMIERGTVLAVLVLLLATTRTLARGEPFTPANARRMSAIGVVVAAGGTIGPIVGQIARSSLLEDYRSVTRLVETQTFEISFLWLAVGLVLAAFGEVFRRGAVLRRDVDGLV